MDWKKNPHDSIISQIHVFFLRNGCTEQTGLAVRAGALLEAFKAKLNAEQGSGRKLASQHALLAFLVRERASTRQVRSLRVRTALRGWCHGTMRSCTPPIIHVIVRLTCVRYLSTPGIAPPVTALRGQVTVTSGPGSLAGGTREHRCPKAACFPAAGLMVRWTSRCGLRLFSPGCEDQELLKEWWLAVGPGRQNDVRRTSMARWVLCLPEL